MERQRCGTSSLAFDIDMFNSSTLADAIEQRYQAGLLPELRRRRLLDTDYQGSDFRSSLDLAPLG
ncbi:hypothetical protein [Pantoea cypripedii]|uniref:Uncharacterized protein n=1 Tax=Pantoea cypripedii TaxID=55209 RepID=A0A6B9GGY1_PANCY|nr:hypothetical protein [Pantoea cypripedii]QGY32586.1 hypothetical protein CUN67_26915 [Pantoea cypripedii]